MHTYFISDLHLTPEKPTVVMAFQKFMLEKAPSADALYILGDLFEYWIGDDAAKMLGAEPALNLMKQISEHTECFFIAGNRDFLVRDSFEQQTGFKILADETVIDLHGTRTLLLHGDSLCTDDHKHQEFRKTMTTNRAFCDQFLSLPIEQRIEQAKQARMQSAEHKSNVSEGIMDVSESAVLNAFKNHNVKQMIHGHTHRQNTHQYTEGVRYVLGDWHETSSIMTVTDSDIKIENFEI